MNYVVGILLILIPNTFCLLDVPLNEGCTETADCAIAYSICTDIPTGAGISARTCACRPGFKAENGLCKPEVHQCPTWKCPAAPFSGPDCLPGKPGKYCEVRNDANDKEFDTCGPTEFCFIYLNTKSELGNSVGHCCKKPPTTGSFRNVQIGCPVGGINSKATCSNPTTRTCSWTTYDCIHKFGSDACCPIPCHGASSHFNVKGKCYDYLMIGEECTYPAQCGGGSYCTSQGAGKPLCLCRGKVLDEPSPHCAV